MQTFLFYEVTANQTSTIVHGLPAQKSFQFTVEGTGASSGATAVIEVSNDGKAFIEMHTFALGGDMDAAPGNMMTALFLNDDPWHFVRARITDVTGPVEATLSIGS